MREATKHRHAAQGAAKVSSATAELGNQRESTAGSSGAPEWSTEHWKHRVEAEARKRLKHELHDVASAHR